MSVDDDDAIRDLRGQLGMVVALEHSREFAFFLSLVDLRIERELRELEKDHDIVVTSRVRGRIVGLRDIAGILNERKTALQNEIRTRGSKP